MNCAAFEIDKHRTKKPNNNKQTSKIQKQQHSLQKKKQKNKCIILNILFSINYFRTNIAVSFEVPFRR